MDLWVPASTTRPRTVPDCGSSATSVQSVIAATDMGSEPTPSVAIERLSYWALEVDTTGYWALGSVAQ